MTIKIYVADAKTHDLVCNLESFARLLQRSCTETSYPPLQSLSLIQTNKLSNQALKYVFTHLPHLKYLQLQGHCITNEVIEALTLCENDGSFTGSCLELKELTGVVVIPAGHLS